MGYIENIFVQDFYKNLSIANSPARTFAIKNVIVTSSLTIWLLSFRQNWLHSSNAQDRLTTTI